MSGCARRPLRPGEFHRCQCRARLTAARGAVVPLVYPSSHRSTEGEGWLGFSILAALASKIQQLWCRIQKFFGIDFLQIWQRECGSYLKLVTWSWCLVINHRNFFHIPDDFLVNECLILFCNSARSINKSTALFPICRSHWAPQRWLLLPVVLDEKKKQPSRKWSRACWKDDLYKLNKCHCCISVVDIYGL